MGKKDLDEYETKRDLSSSGEPEGKTRKRRKGDKPIFVIQKHAASSLHYDFRLKVDGTLKSWAVPKGPSTDPREKRLAVRTEDHPLEYADVEGTIPENEYGAGAVIVWDRGCYENLKDNANVEISDKELDDGHITVKLDGKKLSGGYALHRRGDSDRWLLVKMKDDEADARRNPVSTEPESVISGKTVEDIAQENGGDD